MFERLKAIWRMPNELERKIEEHNLACIMSVENRIKDMEKLCAADREQIKAVIKDFSKILSELRAIEHLDHAKVENFSGRIAKLEDQTQMLEELGRDREADRFDSTVELKCRMSNIEKQQKDLKSRLLGLGANFNELSKTADKNAVPDDIAMENTVADSITLQGKPFEFFVQHLELAGYSNILLKAQRRYINRLLRLLRTTVEDPGKSITEDLRKAEKWNKVLRKRHREWKECYDGRRG